MDLEELVGVRVSPFDVSTRRDSGYRASNSVSASRLDTPVGDLPFAIQAFTEAFIQDQHPVTVFDVVRYSPGVTYRSNDFNEGNANVAIRGFAIGSVQGGNVHVLRDGFHGPSILDFTNVARVEVVKGPSSFLYGQVAPGGIVNVITKSPQDKLAAVADVVPGSYGAYRFQGDVTGPAARGLYYRLAGSYDQDIGYWRPYDAHSWNVAPSVLFQPTDRVSVSVKYERYRKIESPQVMQKPGYNAQAGVVPTASDPNLSGVDVPGLPDTWNSMSDVDFRHSNTTGVSAWIDLRADDHWNLRTAYAHQTYTTDMVLSGNLGMANNQTRLQGRRLRRQIYDNRDDTVEGQAVGRYALGGASVRLLLGAQYAKSRFDRWAAQAPNDPALGTDPIGSPLPLWDLSDPSTWNRAVPIPLSALTANRTDQTTSYRSWSIHGGATVGLLGDRLLVLAGWRRTATRTQLTDRVAGVEQPWVTLAKVTPQYGVLCKVAPGLSAFVSYAESFVPGAGFLTRVDGSVAPAGPTRGQGWDAGFKLDLAGGRLSGTVTAFEVRNRDVVNDLSVTNAQGNVTIYNVPSGVQRSRGVEVDLTFTPVEGWQTYASYSYMDARILEFSGRDREILAQDPTTLDAAGRANYRNVRRYHDAPLQMSAPHLANLWTRYDVRTGALAGVHLAGGVNLVHDQALLPDTPAWARQTYTLLNAAVGYSTRTAGVRWNVEAMGKNLAGARYRPSQSARARPIELLFAVTARL
jgi:iron complex outermembrane receptor protein